MHSIFPAAPSSAASTPGAEPTARTRRTPTLKKLSSNVRAHHEKASKLFAKSVDRWVPANKHARQLFDNF